MDSQNQNTNRVAAIIYYDNNNVVNRLKNLEVNVCYVAEKQKAIVLYCERKYYKILLGILKNTKGFLKLVESDLFKDQNLNF